MTHLTALMGDCGMKSTRLGFRLLQLPKPKDVGTQPKVNSKMKFKIEDNPDAVAKRLNKACSKSADH